MEVWESDPVNLGFQQVGYVSVGERTRRRITSSSRHRRQRAGIRSDLYTGSDAHAFLNKLWPDFKTDNCDIVLHEHRSGYAGTHIAVWGSTRSAGSGVCSAFTAPVSPATHAMPRIRHRGRDRPRIHLLRAGRWVQGLEPLHWEWLGGPSHLDVLYPDGHVEEQMDMWTYWRLLEGEVLLPEGVTSARPNTGIPPVLPSNSWTHPFMAKTAR